MKLTFWQKKPEPQKPKVLTYRGLGMSLTSQNTKIITPDQEQKAFDGLLGGRKVRL